MKEKNFNWEQNLAGICSDPIRREDDTSLEKLWHHCTQCRTLSPRTHLAAQVCPCPLCKGLLSSPRCQSSNPAGHWDVLLQDREGHTGTGCDAGDTHGISRSSLKYIMRSQSATSTLFLFILAPFLKQQQVHLLPASILGRGGVAFCCQPSHG